MYSIDTQSTERGFTLIELLVVIAIIGLLSSVVLASLNTARVKARDARRMSDLKQLNMAITLYFDTHNDWPCKTTSCTGDVTYLDTALGGSVYECLDTALVPTYMSSIPTDPVYGRDGVGSWERDYQYCYTDISHGYRLRGTFEGEPLQQTATYVNGTTCQGGGYDRCDWYGQDCVYVTGGDCDIQWLHLGQH
jgi:prepilin-type N-terminal cleavage/methylation domain-containing protein